MNHSINIHINKQDSTSEFHDNSTILTESEATSFLYVIDTEAMVIRIGGLDVTLEKIYSRCQELAGLDPAILAHAAMTLGVHQGVRLGLDLS